MMIELDEQEISADMFLIEANKYIYHSIRYLYGKGQTPTPLAILEVLKDKHARKVLEDFGGEEYLNILAKQKVNKNNIQIFCQKLKQAYTAYRLYNICTDVQEQLDSDKVSVLNPNEIINIAEIQLLELTNEVQQIKEVYKMGDDTEEILEYRAAHPNAIPGLETGWNKFDFYTNGGQPNDLIMICGRAKSGKSTILTNFATKFAIKDKIPVLYFDTEMSKREQEDRILSILSQIPQKEIVSGMYVLDTEFGKAEDKIKRLREAVKELKEGFYYHIYMPNFTVEKVSAIAKKFKMKFGIQAIFFDYLKLPASSASSMKNAQEYQLLGFMASGLKDLAGVLGLPIYSACQENRTDTKSGKKDENNVGGSDRILHLASKLIFIINKSEEEILKEGEINGNQRLYIAYQRNAESDAPPINIKFDRIRNTMYEV